MIEEDRWLVNKFLENRDERVFREIYHRFTPRLYLLALRLTGGGSADAEDAVQEMWIRVVRKLNEFRWESTLATWLSGILIYCCRELKNRKAHSLSIVSDTPSNFEAVSDGEVSPDLERLILNLPDGSREILVLHDIEGYTHEEIAEKLGIAPGTSKSQLSNARTILRSRLNRKSDTKASRGHHEH
jgi:RNA polymerase sigma-70 factor (ECF subfamily)